VKVWGACRVILHVTRGWHIVQNIYEQIVPTRVNTNYSSVSEFTVLVLDASHRSNREAGILGENEIVPYPPDLGYTAMCLSF
jgi:hypothetical protein